MELRVPKLRSQHYNQRSESGVRGADQTLMLNTAVGIQAEETLYRHVQKQRNEKPSEAIGIEAPDKRKYTSQTSLEDEDDHLH